MSYLVLARKYRPATFDEVAAQDLVISTLKAAIEKGKVSHAYLFTGPRGSGKTTVARILAKALNCEKGPTAKPCNVCARCKDITAGVSLDVIEIDGASHNSVDDVRELNENVRYATAGGYRIYIIDEVHMLSGAAFNALLKTLEEPPAHAVFVLATTEVSKIPATILSRCQRFDFRRIPPPALSTTLQNICSKEGIEIEPEALAILVRKADGSLRDGLSLLDQVWTLSGGKIAKESVEQALGLIGLEIFFDLTDAFAQKDAARALSVFDRVVEKGADIEDFLDQLLYHLRNLLVARLKRHTGELLGLSETERQEYVKRAEQFAEGDILRMMKAVSDLKLNLSRLADPKILVEAELVKLAWLDSTVDLKEVLENLESGGSAPLSSGPGAKGGGST
ncbi:MAG: DNA polymerase III subunit gamma/tau, partial [Limisphaerales bacterium]